RPTAGHEKTPPEFACFGANGCPVPIRGDMDRDGDVDQIDFGLFQSCMTSVGVPSNDPACSDAELDGDLGIGPPDLIIFRNCISGPRIPASNDCIR
ncbi:MAG: hypothetical protein ACUVXJ_01195, partial [Phycisphaerae bacterium]